MNTSKVLVTDGGYKHTLAIVRSLGRKGLNVDVLSHRGYNISFYSKYCSEGIIHNHPKKTEDYIRDLTGILKRKKYDVLLPVSFNTCLTVSKHKEKFDEYTTIPIADYESMEVASDKNKTMRFARKIGVPTPQTYYPKSDEIKEVSEKVDYPVVVKAAKESESLRYANSPEELIKAYWELCDKQTGGCPQVQEYIPGEGYGFFALFNRGKPRGVFQHQRIHEFPLTGGPSTMAKSVHDQALEELGLKILKKLDWHGVGMAEFKRDSRDGKFKLIELNPKFWGSLELAIASGVDFPYLTYKMAVDGDIEPVFRYKEGVVFRWLMPGEVLYTLARPDKISAIHGFIRLFLDRSIGYDISLGDIKPNIFQCFETIFRLLDHMKNRSLRYPQGRPKIK